MHTRPMVLTILILAGISFVPDARAQTATPANRVRVVESSSGHALIVGQLVRRTNEGVVIVPDSLSAQGIEQLFALGTQHRLERSVGVRRRTLRGLGIGLLAGAVGGGILGAATYKKPDCTGALFCFDFGRGLSAIGGALTIAVPGLVVGGIVGANKKYEAWRPIDGRGVHVAIAPSSNGGMQFRATMAF